MPTELLQLSLAVLLAFVQLTLYAVKGNLDLGVGYTAGPRDTAPEGASTTCLRLKRAYENHLETLPWFAIAVLVAHLTNTADTIVIASGWAYLAARALYVPAYVSGIPFLRSVIWAAATLAILVITLRPLAG